ncbi:hypothetical protein EsDP_00002462 [Epichloe bromicola]|uniref:Uncharacterized protein n=1 Tax=Epichloe bromicola TaxID=79588 RepID=A0ABQ0CLD1_9HYPO
MALCDLNPKSSIHRRFVAGFVRHGCGELIQCFGPSKNLITSRWLEIRPQLLQSRCYNAYPNRPSQTAVRLEVGLEMMHGRQPQTSTCCYSVFETLNPSTRQILGLVLAPNAAASPCAHEAERAEQFDYFLSSLILGNLHVGTAVDKSVLRGVDVEAVTDSIVDLFDGRLRYASSCDKWGEGGREVFRENVSHFTRRGQKVEFCLPAFPCKSSSTGKVLSEAPDRGEYMALANMHTFIRDIEAIYKPGAKLWIISDGHVFSDCIGVDDDVVDTYSAHLQAMNQEIVRLQGGEDSIGFMSLPELFASRDGEKLSGARGAISMLPEICHHIPTKMTDEAEMCRKILVMGFQLDDAELRKLLSTQDASTIALYRGFSKFMLEDLTTNKYTSHLSRSQLRKKSAKVAFEMIQILFPYHVRLSIHAHDNSGPKFGIQMLGKGVVPTDVLPPDGTDMDCCDKLHVPTPWHNCIVEIHGDPNLYITKSSVARSALSSGDYVGKLHESSDQGGYAHLTRWCGHI